MSSRLPGSLSQKTSQLVLYLIAAEESEPNKMMASKLHKFIKLQPLLIDEGCNFTFDVSAAFFRMTVCQVLLWQTVSSHRYIDMRKLINKGCNLINLYSLLVTILTWVDGFCLFSVIFTYLDVTNLHTNCKLPNLS